MFALLLLSLAAPRSQEKLEESIQSLIRGWNEDDPAKRDRSTRAVLGRWKEWSPEDLERLRDASRSGEIELSSRAREALGTIELRRRLGVVILEKIPDIETVIHNGNPEARLDLLERAAALWRAEELGDPPLEALVTVARAWSLEPTRLFVIAQPRVLTHPDPVNPYAPLIAPALEDDQVLTRGRAALLLGQMGAKPYAASIARLLKDRDAFVRKNGILALSTLGSTQYAGQIAEALSDPAAEVILEAIGAVGHLRVENTYGKLVPLLASDSDELAARAAEVLGQAAARPEAPAVAELLGSPEEGRRYRAAEVLGRMGACEYSGKVAALLREKRAVDPELPIRVATEALGRMAAEDQMTSLLPLLSHRDVGVKAEAVRALGWIGRREVADRLIPLLGDPNPQIQWNAVAALVDLGARDRSAEIAGLLEDENGAARAMAIIVLGQLGARDQLEKIAAQLDHHQPLVRAEAVKVFVRLCPAARAREAMPLFDDDFAAVRLDTALALSRLSPSALQEKDLKEILGKLPELESDASGEVQQAAAMARLFLGQGNLEAQRKFLLQFREDQSDAILEALLENLTRLHVPSGLEKLSREIALDQPVDSIERLRDALQKAGLRFGGAEGLKLTARVPAGARTTPRRLLRRLWESRLVVLDQDTIRIMEEREALEHWERKLAGK
jgi:HEAT repeat protein